MGFLAPLALSFAAISVPILIFYMLKLRREERTVSSTMLWQQVLNDRQANSPWQRLRHNLLLMLQLLVLFLLAMALARPYSEMARIVQGNLIVLLDASASMQATDVSPSRFESARAHARQIIESIGPNDTVTLIAVGDIPRVLTSLTHDRSVLRQALSSAQVTRAQGDWESAFSLASSSAQPSVGNTFVILSDGGIPADLPELPGQVRYVPIGITADNQAISALAVRDGPQGPQAFVRVSNPGTRTADPVVQIYTDGILFDARELSLPPGGERGISLDDLPLDTRQVEARLTPSQNRGSSPDSDHFALDDVAWAVRAPGDRATILLATQGNTFLERVIGLLPNLTLVTLRVTGTITNVQIVPPATTPALYIYDGVLPTRLPESGNQIFIAPPRSTSLFSVTGILTGTQLTRVAGEDPLLRYVDLDDLHVSNARAVVPPPWTRILVQGAGGPLLMAGETGGRRAVIFAFDLHHSDLPLQIAFPILMSNLVGWLAPTSSVEVPAQLSPGTPVALRPQVGVTEIAVLSPSGERWTFSVEDSAPIPFAQTGELGIYTVVQRTLDAPAFESLFAVNLFSELESRIEPQDALAIGQASVSGQATGTTGRREWWRWLALAGLIVLLAEWVVHWRGHTMLPFGWGRSDKRGHTQH